MMFYLPPGLSKDEIDSLQRSPIRRNNSLPTTVSISSPSGAAKPQNLQQRRISSSQHQVKQAIDRSYILRDQCPGCCNESPTTYLVATSPEVLALLLREGCDHICGGHLVNPGLYVQPASPLNTITVELSTVRRSRRNHSATDPRNRCDLARRQTSSRSSSANSNRNVRQTLRPKTGWCKKADSSLSADQVTAAFDLLLLLAHNLHPVCFR